MAARRPRRSSRLEAGKSYDVVVEYSREKARAVSLSSAGLSAPLADDAIERAATLAAASDVALVFAGSERRVGLGGLRPP